MDNESDKLAALVAKGDVPEGLLSWMEHCLDSMDSDTELHDSLSQTWDLTGEELLNHLVDSYNLLVAWQSCHEQIEGLDGGKRAIALFVIIEASKEKVSPSAVLKEGFTEDGGLADNEYGDIIRRAFASRDRYLDAFERTERLPKALKKIPTKVDVPTDRLNNEFVWRDPPKESLNEENLLAIRAEGRGSKKEATIYYGVFLDEVNQEYTRGVSGLTEYDKAVFIAVCSLYGKDKNRYITIKQIYEMMGGMSEKPSANQIKKINDSLDKMALTRITIDNSYEITTHKNYPLFKVTKEYLLPFKRGKMLSYGNVADGIELYDEPPLMRFARSRSQVTTIQTKVLQIPDFHWTEGNLRLRGYLLWRLIPMKYSGKKKTREMSHKITYKDMYSKLGIDGQDSAARKARSDLTGKVRKCLNHFQNVGYISGYKEGEDGITIIP